MLTVNQLYKKSGTKMPFKMWLEKGKDLHSRQIEANLVPSDLSFEGWASLVEESTTLGTDGKKKVNWSKVGDMAKKGVTLGAGIISSSKSKVPETSQAKPQPESSGLEGTATPKNSSPILGLKPIVFYSLAGVALLGVGFVVFKIVKSKINK